MVPEHPPRRPKPKKEPVTIDLTAAEDTAVAEPVRSNDADDGPSAEAMTETMTEATTAAEEDRPPEEASDTGRNSADVSPAEEPPAETSPAEELPAEASPLDEQPVEEAAAATDRESPEPIVGSTNEPQFRPDGDMQPESGPESGPEAPPPAAAPGRQGVGVPALIAAGVFGGIVALVLAGSMQYAGYLPAATTTPEGPDVSAEIATVSAEMASLRQEIETIRQAPPPPAPDTGLNERIQAIETTLAQRPADDTAERLAALEQELAGIRSAAESTAAESAGRIGQLQERLAVAEARLDEPGEEAVVARAIAAAALKSAIDRGGAFATELETFAGVAADDPAVAPLQPFSSTGVPSRAELVEAFPAAADAILEAVTQPPPDQGIADRLMASALSVVKVRRIGDAEGDTPEAIVARMEDALKRGDLPASANAWQALPEAGKAASADFKQSLDARIRVEALVDETLSRAVTDTGSKD